MRGASEKRAKLRMLRGERVVAARNDRTRPAIYHAGIAHLGEQFVAIRQAAASFGARTPQVEESIEDVSTGAGSSDEERAARFQKSRDMANQRYPLIDREVIDIVVEHGQVEVRARRTIPDVSRFDRRARSYSPLRKTVTSECSYCWL